ncbi:conserved hypothetical protein [Ricinus communis]|uniref:Uncharacterized protein n=1 Tax=Ricinus communis TaxID=3988 RepID=B9TFE9_RICCO|nr:conserved hypothetical protein [Ricinus communis]
MVDGIDQHHHAHPSGHARNREQRARQHPQRHQEDHHHGVEACGGAHAPGQHEAQSRETQAGQHEGHQQQSQIGGPQVQAQEGRGQGEDQRLDHGDGGAAGHLAQHDGQPADGRGQNALQETGVAILDDGDRAEDAGEQHHHEHHAGIEIFKIGDALHPLGTERSAHARAQEQPEQQGLGHGADHAGGLTDETDQLALGERKSDAQHVRFQSSGWRRWLGPGLAPVR